MSRRRRDGPDGDTAPNALDPRSGFKIKHRDLAVDGQTRELVDRRFTDKKHPQDFVRGVREQIALPNARPEPPDISVALPILSELGNWLFTENGRVILDEGLSLSL